MTGREGARWQLVAAIVLALVALRLERRWVYVAGPAGGMLLAGLVDAFWPG